MILFLSDFIWKKEEVLYHFSPISLLNETGNGKTETVKSENLLNIEWAEEIWVTFIFVKTVVID